MGTLKSQMLIRHALNDVGLETWKPSISVLQMSPIRFRRPSFIHHNGMEAGDFEIVDLENFDIETR